MPRLRQRQRGLLSRPARWLAGNLVQANCRAFVESGGVGVVLRIATPEAGPPPEARRPACHRCDLPPGILACSSCDACLLPFVLLQATLRGSSGSSFHTRTAALAQNGFSLLSSVMQAHTIGGAPLGPACKRRCPPCPGPAAWSHQRLLSPLIHTPNPFPAAGAAFLSGGLDADFEWTMAHLMLVVMPISVLMRVVQVGGRAWLGQRWQPTRSELLQQLRPRLACRWLAGPHLGTVVAWRSCGRWLPPAALCARSPWLQWGGVVKPAALLARHSLFATVRMPAGDGTPWMSACAACLVPAPPLLPSPLCYQPQPA